MRRMKIGLWMVIGLFGVAGFPFIAGAGGDCFVGKTRCIVENGAPRIDDRTREEARKQSSSTLAADVALQQLIAPIKSNPVGQSYGNWSATWWKWVLGIPVAVNPLLDTTGEFCTQGQVDKVWFLAGTFGGTADRSCTVPTGKALFFPLINNFAGAFLTDPAEQRTEEYIRALASCTVPANISASIDGSPIPNPTDFFTGPSGSPSPIFNVQLPPGSLFGDDVPELKLTPSAEQGYYLLVRPLPPGKHTIRWTASGCTPGNSQDITYHLTVKTGK